MAVVLPYLPWWHSLVRRWTRQRRRLTSGCKSDGDGRIACIPDAMRVAADLEMRRLQVWGDADPPLTLAEYTLARYINSEQGAAGPENKVCVAELAVNRVALEGLSGVNTLLLQRGIRAGYYGPIQECPTCPSKWGRWATTFLDPYTDDVLIARFVLNGASGDWCQSADDQWGGEYLDMASIIAKAARDHLYWTGHVTGVDHWTLSMFQSLPSVPADSTAGKALVARALTAFASKAKIDWSGYPTGVRASTGETLPPGPRAPGGAVVLGALALSVSATYAFTARLVDKKWFWE